ncbi:MAG: helix-turn-helix domain-containing protein [Gammaproteobacteria bacterium]|nr:helix-turn-helix domain-containing protein [Gammaproteobacteria bacterium]
MTTPPVEPETTRNTGVTPGQRLRQARERLELDLAEVAGSLRLSTTAVEALERDDYHSFAAPAYTRGYLRNYARLVNVSEALILTHLDDADHTRNIPEIRSYGSRFERSEPHIGRWIALLLALLLGGALWFAFTQGWLSRDNTTSETTPNSQIIDLDTPR